MLNYKMIESMIPDYTGYIDLFGTEPGLFLEINRGKYIDNKHYFVFNDNDCEVLNFFKGLKNGAIDLINKCEHYNISKFCNRDQFLNTLKSIQHWTCREFREYDILEYVSLLEMTIFPCTDDYKNIIRRSDTDNSFIFIKPTEGFEGHKDLLDHLRQIKGHYMYITSESVVRDNDIKNPIVCGVDSFIVTNFKYLSYAELGKYREDVFKVCKESIC